MAVSITALMDLLFVLWDAESTGSGPNILSCILGLQLPAAAAAKSLQSCPTLCDPIDGSPPGSPVPGILQARTLEWVTISFSSAWKWKVKVKSLSRVWLLATPWTAAHQAPPSMGFARQEYWSGVPLPSLLQLTSCTILGNLLNHYVSQLPPMYNGYIDSTALTDFFWGMDWLVPVNSWRHCIKYGTH